MNYINDVGKVVGTDSVTGEDIYVISSGFFINGWNGQYFRKVVLSNGTIIEHEQCRYCGKWPCPDYDGGSRKNCSEYDIKKDPSYYCQTCGKSADIHSTYFDDTNCHNCGKWVKAFACHICPDKCTVCGAKVTERHYLKEHDD